MKRTAHITLWLAPMCAIHALYVSLGLTTCPSICLAESTTSVESERLTEQWTWIRSLGCDDLTHASAVTSLNFSPDGLWLLSTSCDHTVRVWSVETGKEIRRLKGHTAAVTCSAFSADGELVATGGGWNGDDVTVRVYDFGTGKERDCFHGHKGWVTSVEFSQDGTHVCSTGEWDRGTLEFQLGGKPRRRGVIREPDLSAASKEALAYLESNTTGWKTHRPAHDGKIAICGKDDSFLHLVDLQTGKVVKRFDCQIGFVTATAFSPDGKTVAAAAGASSIHLFDVASGREKFPHGGRMKHIRAIAPSRVGNWVLAAGGDRSLHIWNLETGVEEPPFPRDDSSIHALAISGDGKVALTRNGAGKARVWDIKSRKAVQDFPPQQSGTAVAIAPDCQRLLVGNRLCEKHDGVWAFERGTTLQDAEAFDFASFAPDGISLLTTEGSDEPLVFWHAKTGQPLAGKLESDGHRTVAVSDDMSMVLFGCDEGTLRLFSLSRPKITEPSHELLDLYGKLGNEAFTVREEATKALIRLGVPAWNALAGLKPSSDEEVRQRMMRLFKSCNTHTLGSKLAEIKLKGFIQVLAIAPCKTWWAAGISGPDSIVTAVVIGSLNNGDLVPRARFDVDQWPTCLAFTPDSKHLLIGNANGTLAVLGFLRPIGR